MSCWCQMYVLWTALCFQRSCFHCQSLDENKWVPIHIHTESQSKPRCLQRVYRKYAKSFRTWFSLCHVCSSFCSLALQEVKCKIANHLELVLFAQQRARTTDFQRNFTSHEMSWNSQVISFKVKMPFQKIQICSCRSHSCATTCHARPAAMWYVIYILGCRQQ